MIQVVVKKALLLSFLLLFSLISTAQTSKAFKKSIKKHRKTYKKAFLKNEHSPLDKKGVKQLAFFEADANYQVTCSFKRTTEAQPFEMATYSGVTKPYVKYGVATCPIYQTNVELAVYQSLRLIKMPQYRDHLFIPFKDETNDDLTYGGGRYMDITLGDIRKNEVVLDFNKGYNPYCAYSDGYSCPVPPLENHLDLKILAGEKGYKKPTK